MAGAVCAAVLAGGNRGQMKSAMVTADGSSHQPALIVIVIVPPPRHAI